MKKTISMLLVIITLFTMAACSASTSPAPNSAQETTTNPSAQNEPSAISPISNEAPVQTLHLYYKYPNDFNSYDFTPPWAETDIIGNLMWLTLLEADKNMDIQGGEIFNDWNVSDDGLTFTFTMRTDLLWSDGTPITIEDITWSLECCSLVSSLAIVKDALKYLEGFEEFENGNASHISGITTDGDVLTLKLTEPYAPFLKVMGQIAPLPKHIYENCDMDNFKLDPIWQEINVNSGQFVITEHVPGNYFILEPNPYYGGDQSQITRIECKASPDGVVDAQAGEIDILFSTDYEVYKAMSNTTDYSVEMIDIIYYSFLCFNFFDEAGAQKDYVSDVRVRQAIAYAVDWETVISGLYGDFAEMTQTGVLPSDKNYIGDWYEYNPEKAKQLLDEANFDYSHTIKVFYYLTEQTCVDLMDAMAYYLDQIGVKMEAVHTANAGGDIYQSRTQDMAYFVLYGYDELTWYQMYTRTAMDNMLGCIPVFSDAVKKLETAYTDELWNEAIKEVQNLDKENVFFLPINTLKYQAWKKNTLETPEDCFGNTVYFYDLQFENWRITE